LPISDLHENDTNGLPELLGQVVVVRGVVTLADELGIAAYMEDATGGIVVYDAAFAQGVEIGHDVTVIGTLTQFNGLAELTPGAVIETHATGVDVEPTVVTCLQITNQGAGGEPYEARLVRINGVTVEGLGLLGRQHELRDLRWYREVPRCASIRTAPWWACPFRGTPSTSSATSASSTSARRTPAAGRCCRASPPT
jgi:hypothetical protein